ncbi:MAG: aquaporin family protein [Gemmataceae bacterium]|nr:aquaporin family protein [Gemmataceae bacterium]
MPPNPLPARCLAEVLGTFILVFLGCGAVHAAVLTGAQSGLWQVAIVWGVAVMLAVYVVGGVSGSHINPAITVALTVWGRSPWRDALPYILAQLAGGALAGAALFVLYEPSLAAREQQRGVKRGEPGSEITAMCYGEYFPNPSPVSADDTIKDRETLLRRLKELEPRADVTIAVLAEILGTALLALVVFAVTDERNHAAPAARLGPAFIGLTVAVLISVIAPLTQACFNPARDFGPRLVAWAAGWGEVALPGPRPGVFRVYLFAPILGAVLGGGVYLGLVRPFLTEPLPPGRVTA